MTLEEAYIEFMGELKEYYEEEKTQAEECTERKLPSKQKDPVTFTVPVCFGSVQRRSLCDLGSSISLMSLQGNGRLDNSTLLTQWKLF
ncbi:hypothetical protein A2U01_0074141 [Trifolium medium]|uniref:Uncharacterized protein n=1 Tax=Trifolium medium TaxID=97028 RepID=A0A392SXW2_9FABA|nr:hypothetical protein [Trifolium medium]